MPTKQSYEASLGKTVIQYILLKNINPRNINNQLWNLPLLAMLKVKTSKLNKITRLLIAGQRFKIRVI